MGPDDTQVPAPRRAGVPFRRQPAPTSEPRVADLSALLGDIDALRTTLQTDLSFAAAALDAGADGLAGELVNGDLRAVHDFEARALAHLRALDDPAPDALEPVGSGTGGSRSRRRRLLPAAPLLVAAAALVGFAVGVVPERAVSQPEPVMSSAAEASYELSRLALEGAPSEALRDAAEQLNDEVVELVAGSDGSPAAATEALWLLQRGTEVLISQGDQGPLQGVLAEARQLADELRRALPTAAQNTLPPVLSDPDVPVVQKPATGPLADEPSLPPRDAASPAPRPSSAPAPSAAPSPAPATAPAPAPSSTGGSDDAVLTSGGQLPDF